MIQVFAFIFCLGANAASLDVTDLIRRTEQQSLGNSFTGKLHMTIQRPDGNRDLEILSWTENRDKAVVKVLKPAKDRGVANLRLEYNLWQYLPNIERTIKIPPSLMLQNWMGSDFTNDDLVKSTRLTRDYTSEFEGYEQLDGKKVAKIICHPKPDAPVVWGKLELWIDPDKAVLLQQDFYTENGEKIKRLTATDVKTFGSHTIATTLKMETLKKQTTTTLQYRDVKYDQPMDAALFSQNYLKAPLRDN